MNDRWLVESKVSSLPRAHYFWVMLILWALYFILGALYTIDGHLVEVLNVMKAAHR